MSEGEAHRRITVARIVRQFPRALELLERGDVHLSAVYALRDHLTQENHEELLREAIGKSTREVHEMIAARFPRPDVAACIEPVAPQAHLPVVLPNVSGRGAASLAGSFGAETRPTIEPLSATRYRIEVTVSAEIKAKLERIKDLMRHRNPAGDLEILLDASLDLLLAKLERERLGKVSRPRRANRAEPKMPAAAGAEPTTNETAPAQHGTGAEQRGDDASVTTRRQPIPRPVRRHVFERDGEQCSYVDAEGNRCPARAFLELHHVHPKALRGDDDAVNLRVRCRPHNQLYAEQVYGRQYVAARIHLRRHKYTSPSARFDTAAQALGSLGFTLQEVRRAISTLETRLGEETPIETIIREALLILT